MDKFIENLNKKLDGRLKNKLPVEDSSSRKRRERIYYAKQKYSEEDGKTD